MSSYQQIQINNSNKICNIILMCFLNSSSHSAIFCVHRFLLLITFVRGRRWRHECAALRNKKCGEYVKVLSKIKKIPHTHTHTKACMDRRVHRIFTGFLYCVFWFHRLCFCFLYISSYFTFSANHQEAGFFGFVLLIENIIKHTHTLAHTSIHTYVLSNPNLTFGESQKQ